MENRRLGERVAPTDLTILWCPPGTKPGARRASKRPAEARVLDISHAGLQVVAPADDRIQRGTALLIILQNLPCEVRVRWIGPTNVEGVLAYGIEFVAPSHEFEDVVRRIIRECYERDGIPLKEPPIGRRTVW